MRILSIETSCDETAAAVLEFKNGGFWILANVVASSVKLQAKYGGIVPEVAARQQMIYIMPVIEEVLVDAFGKKGKKLGKLIDYICVTNGPGLVTSLRVGVEAAKSLGYAWGKPLVKINHLEGHLYSAELNNFQFPISNFQKNSKFQISNSRFIKLGRIKFPALGLIVSGGHTELVLMKDYLEYKVIGRTLDDAVGEAFDKVAKMLNLGYPGGPIISKLAEKGDAAKIKMPRPMINSGDYNFSFSGLKTAVLYAARKQEKKITGQQLNDFCASFQKACIDVLVAKSVRAIKEFGVKSFLLGGGVAANGELRSILKEEIHKNFHRVKIFIPEMKYTGDNAVIIGLAGYYRVTKTLNRKNTRLQKYRNASVLDLSKIGVDPNLRLDGEK